MEIEMRGINKSFGNNAVLNNAGFVLSTGEIHALMGENGAGKSTFLKILSGELDSTTGEVSIDPNCRMSVLKQDHFAYDEYTVLDTIIMGNKRLYDIMKEKDALYEKEDFSDEDGIKAAELEAEFAEMDGWEADSNASKLMQGLGLDESIMYSQMADLGGNEKVKVLLAQALFGDPDIILLDEPTNHLDLQAIEWLEDFLLDYEGTVIVVSHDRYFLNVVCTHIVDIDYSKVKMYVGNYEFWYESSQMMERLIKQQNKKAEEKIKELQTFIQRFSANKSKSKQATSRKKMLDKLTVEELPASSRRYPFVGFDMDREAGRDLLTVDGLSKTVNGEKLLNNISFTLNHDDKIAIIGENEIAITALMQILAGEDEIDTMIFDEIDTGISGKTAQMVADKLMSISKEHQVICISHLAQIAAMADSHYLIEKNTDDESTETNIYRLSREDSIKELVRISSGGEITETAIKHATEMKEMAERAKLGQF